MDYEFTEKQKRLRRAIEQFSDSEIASKASILDQYEKGTVGELMKERFIKLAQAGYLSIGHDISYGGTDLDLVSQCIVYEAIAKACASTALSVFASVGLVGSSLKLFGTDVQKEQFLPGLLNGSLIGCFGYSENDAGSDILNIGTTARKVRDKWVINGIKDLVTNAPIADLFIVLSLNGKGSGPGEETKAMTFFILPKGTDGLRVEDSIDTLGFRGSPLGKVHLENCEVEESFILGKGEERGLDQVTRILDFAMIMMSSLCVGISMGCLEEAVIRAKTRKAFGNTIGSYQEVGFKLADMFTYSDLGRLLTQRAAVAMESNEKEARMLASCAKVFTSEGATKIASWALQIFGGHGYIKGESVERFYRDAKLGEIAFGTPEVLRTSIIAKDILDRFSN